MVAKAPPWREAVNPYQLRCFCSLWNVYFGVCLSFLEFGLNFVILSLEKTGFDFLCILPMCVRNVLGGGVTLKKMVVLATGDIVHQN